MPGFRSFRPLPIPPSPPLAGDKPPLVSLFRLTQRKDGFSFRPPFRLSRRPLWSPHPKGSYVFLLRQSCPGKLFSFLSSHVLYASSNSTLCNAEVPAMDSVPKTFSPAPHCSSFFNSNRALPPPPSHTFFHLAKRTSCPFLSAFKGFSSFLSFFLRLKSLLFPPSSLPIYSVFTPLSNFLSITIFPTVLRRSLALSSPARP